MPFDGYNPRSVVMMDNASIHHLERANDIITGVGAKLVFLPPYSPVLMPLEEVFAKVKGVLKANDGAYLASSNPELICKTSIHHNHTKRLLGLYQTFWIHVNVHI